jgi:hypothetical protein
VISDVATTGNSGSGVFDAGNKCLLGIMSRKIYVPANSADPESKEKDIAKYFCAGIDYSRLHTNRLSLLRCEPSSTSISTNSHAT